jgi:hypothetical protein
LFSWSQGKHSCNTCPSNIKYIETDYGEPQEISGENFNKIEKRVQDAERYMKTKVAKHSMYQFVRDSCMNRDKLCSQWATEGECEKNPAWMLINVLEYILELAKSSHSPFCMLTIILKYTASMFFMRKN